MKTLFRILPLIMLYEPLALSADIVLPDIVGDNMVLQQQSQAALWGWADAGDTVRVSASWCPSATVSAVADSGSGRWTVKLPTPEASFAPQQVVIASPDTVITLNNVLVGEVWFCSGQSNMEMPLRGFPSQPVEGAAEAIAYSGTYPGIRVAKVPKRVSYTLRDRVESPWAVSSPANAAEFSALAYFYAMSLTRMLNVPVGIIDCSYGGSKVEAWQSAAALEAYPDFNLECEKTDSLLNDWERINVMYNAMLYPLAGYTVKGFLWNQGESNVGRHATYPYHLRDMVAEWRTLWGDNSLPFYFVEIPGWNYGNPDGTDAAKFRDCQHFAATIIPNSGIVGTSDLVYPSEVNDIHARRKREIGERLAYMTAAKTYGFDGMPVDYPEFDSMTVQADKATLRFKNAPFGLTPSTGLEGFEVAGDDGLFVAAEAVVDPLTMGVEVRHPLNQNIKHVRYNYKNFSIGKVFDHLGLPLTPFTTESGKGK